MSFSVFGLRRSEEPDEAPEPEAVQEVVKVPPFREVAGQWREQLAEQISHDLGADKPARLTLPSAHPGGLARLYAERPTKLSSLVRDPAELASATAGAVAVVRQAQSMAAQHGSAVAHLGIGAASWGEGNKRRTVPILLRPVDVTIDQDGEVTLALRPGVEVSGGLLDVLARQGSPLEPNDLLDRVRTPAGFSPAEGIHAIREAGRNVPDLEVSETLTLGIFVHPTSALLRELGAPQWLSLSPVARALSGDQGAIAELDVPLPDPNPRDRNPWDERGLGDQTPEAQDIVEAATGDGSLLIKTGDADLTGLSASVAAELAATGDQVLVVTGSPEISAQISDYMESRGATDIAVVIDGSRESAERVQEQLKSALIDASDDLDRDELDRVRTDLRRVREALADYTASLHQPFPEWGVSAVDALQELTDLTSIPGGPATAVRFSAEVLSALASDQGKRARDLLARASGLGVFSPDADSGWWTAVEIADPEQVQVALSALVRLHEEYLPAAAEQMSGMAEETGLLIPQNIEQWERELAALGGIKESLDVFKPEVFERSAADMVLATASRQWRKERGLRIRGSHRKRLVSQAKDLVIPGRYVEDLHAELTLVQARREAWREYAEAGGWPRLPADLDNLVELLNRLSVDLEAIAPFLEPAYGDVFQMPIAELQLLVGSLLADSKGARELPAKVNTLRALSEMGLGELVEDLKARGVDGDLLGLELDLAWWASALGLMLAAEPKLGGLDPSALQSALLEERQLDQMQVELLGPAIRSRIVRRRAAALATQIDTYVNASQAFSVPASASSYYARVPFSWSLVPIVITAPTLVPAIVPWGRHVDTVILAGVEQLPLAELIPVIARGRKVVVIGSEQSPALSALEEVLPTIAYRGSPQPVPAVVASLLADHGVVEAAVSVPSRRAAEAIDFVGVAGTGMPAPGQHAIETSTAEVEAVVSLVQDHLQTRPQDSVAVVALNERHAGRIQDALRRAAGEDESLAAALSADGPHSVEVITPAQAEGIHRDRVILSVGYSKTPHGRVIHDFGPYSEPGGEETLAAALRVSRADLTVVSSLSSAEIDPERLRQPGAKLLVDLLRLAEEGVDNQEWPTTEAAPDHLLVDLAERLYRLGLDVVPNLGLPGGKRIPLAIGHPEVEGELLVAILTDDDEYLKQPSQRVRDRLWPQMLEAQGWKVRTELSMAVFIDPNHEAEAIVRLVLDAVDEHNLPGDPVEAEPGEDVVGEDVDGEVAEGASEGEPAFEQSGEGDSVEPAPADNAADTADEPAEQVAEEAEVEVQRGPRPPIAPGMPLSAYGDDQLDEIARWVLSGPELSDEQAVEELRSALAVGRRGAQVDAVLANVVRRNR